MSKRQATLFDATPGPSSQARGRPVQPLNQHVDDQRKQGLLEIAIVQSRVLTDAEKNQLITSTQANIAEGDLDRRYFTIEGARKRKQISFQQRWLQEYTWLRYESRESHRGGWCLPCIFFLNQSERASLGVFVKTPFVNYNKSKEICRKHAQTDYHSRAVTRAYHFRKNYSNPEQRIDSRLSDINARNFRLNSEALPAIVEAVIMCAMQRIALQGHQQDKIDFGSARM